MAEPEDRGAQTADDDTPAELTSPLRVLDHAFLGILAGNAMTFAAALTQHWSVTPILWIFWCQSVIIGVVNVVRILSLREFSTAGLTMNGRPVEETEGAKRGIAGFFALHYGIFHLVYAAFLMSRSARDPVSPVMQQAVLVNVLVFAIAHFYPVVTRHATVYTSRKPNLGVLLFYPYLRIVPMHLTIIFGSMLPAGALPLFLGLKTAADLGMHLVEHRLFRGVD